MSEDIILKFFADYIEKNLGIVYSETNYFQLSHRLFDIANQLGLKNIEELYSQACISIEGNLKRKLLDLATNNETSFYRDAHIFKALGQLILPSLISNQPEINPIRIWSAASSSGQEVYTIAMELDQYQKTNPNSPNFSILASDISETILKRAQSGVYSQLEVQRGLPAKNLIEYFDQVENNQWKVKDFLRKNIEFRKINLLDYWSDLEIFDIIFCRNVLIYQNVENKTKVVNQFTRVLRPGGFLVLGAAESLFGISEQFEQVTQDKIIVYRKKITTSTAYKVS